MPDVTNTTNTALIIVNYCGVFTPFFRRQNASCQVHEGAAAAAAAATGGKYTASLQLRGTCTASRDVTAAAPHITAPHLITRRHTHRLDVARSCCVNGNPARHTEDDGDTAGA